MALLADVSPFSFPLLRRQSGALRRIILADIQEIYGQHYVLPELGPLGGHGLANPRDFETPLASFDIDQSPWEGESFVMSHVFGRSSNLL